MLFTTIESKLEQLSSIEEQSSATKLGAIEEEGESEREMKKYPSSGDEEAGADWKQQEDEVVKQQTAVSEETQELTGKREQWLLQCEETLQMYKEHFQHIESENEQLRKQIRVFEEDVQVPEGATGMPLYKHCEASTS